VGGDRAVVLSVGAGIVHINVGDRSRSKKGLTLRVQMERLAAGTGRGMAMLARKVRKSWSVLVMAFVMVLPMSIALAPASQALDDCGFGFAESGYDDNADPICEKSTWNIIKNNDGFDRVVEASVGVDNSDIENDPYDFRLYVRCTSKKLEVFAATTYELFYENAYRSGGPTQVRFDSGKIANYKFSKSTSNKGIFLNNPKTFSTALGKAKNKVALKFTSSRGITVLHFPVGDFAQSKKAFSSAGCKF